MGLSAGWHFCRGGMDEMEKQVKPLVKTVDTFFLLTEPASTKSSPRYERVTRRPHTTVTLDC